MPKPYEVRVTKQAQDQVSEIFDYICEENCLHEMLQLLF